MAVMTDLAMQDFDERGEVFPIHYTCLGWEAIAVKVTSNPYILSARSVPPLVASGSHPPAPHIRRAVCGSTGDWPALV